MDDHPYVKSVTGKFSPNTIRAIERILKRLDGVPLDVDEIERALWARTGTSRRHYMSIALNYFRWKMDRVGTDEEEFELSRLVRRLERVLKAIKVEDTSSEFQALTPGQLGKLFSVLPDKDKPIFQFMLRTGLRACEMAQLPHCILEIAENGRGGVLLIPQAKGKKLVTRRPILPEAVDLFVPAKQALAARSGSARGIHDMVRYYMKKAEVGGYRAGSHTLRRTFCTKLLRKRVPIGVVAKLMGHADIKNTERYAKVDMARLVLEEMEEKGYLK
jgi:integrase